jgi:hypothetical protein
MAIKSYYRTVKRIPLAVMVTAIVVLMLAGVSYANVRATVPADPYAPIYADWYGNEELVTFIFYRNASCVPSTFNVFIYGRVLTCPAKSCGFRPIIDEK